MNASFKVLLFSLILHAAPSVLQALEAQTPQLSDAEKGEILHALANTTPNLEVGKNPNASIWQYIEADGRRVASDEFEIKKTNFVGQVAVDPNNTNLRWMYFTVKHVWNPIYCFPGAGAPACNAKVVNPPVVDPKPPVNPGSESGKIDLNGICSRKFVPGASNVGSGEYQLQSQIPVLRFESAAVRARIQSLDGSTLGNVSGRIGEESFAGAEFSLHGNTSRAYAKKSFKLKLAEKPSADLFGIPGKASRQKNLVFNASWIDPTFMRNKMVMDATRALGSPAPMVGYAIVCMGSEFWGLYNTIERIKDPFLERYGLAENSYLVKAENQASWYTHEITDLVPVPGEPGEFNVMKGEMVSFELKDVGDAQDTNAFETDFASLFACGVKGECNPKHEIFYQDMLTFAKVNIFNFNADTWHKNYYLFYDLNTDNGVWRMFPWDADATFGLNGYGYPDGVGAYELNGDRGALGHWPCRWYLNHKDAFIAALEKDVNGLFAGYQQRVDQMAQMLKPYADIELDQKWRRDGLKVKHNRARVSFGDEVSWLKEMISERTRVMKETLKQRPNCK